MPDPPFSGAAPPAIDAPTVPTGSPNTAKDLPLVLVARALLRLPKCTHAVTSTFGFSLDCLTPRKLAHLITSEHSSWASACFVLIGVEGAETRVEGSDAPGEDASPKSCSEELLAVSLAPVREVR